MALHHGKDLGVIVTLLAITTTFGYLLSQKNDEQRAEDKKSEGISVHNVGIIHHEPRHVTPGYYLFTSERVPKLTLINEVGETIKELRFEPDKILAPHERWRDVVFFHVEPTPDKALIAVVTDQALIKVNWQGAVLWRTLGRYHHDVAVTDDGDVFTLSRKVRTVKASGKRFRILDDLIVHISKSGGVVKEISLYDSIAHLVPLKTLRESENYVKERLRKKKRVLNDSAADFMHTNSVEMVTKNIPGVAQKGDLLVSMRENNLVATLDPDSKKLRWTLPYITDAQHDPKFLPNGNLLLFDNGRSRTFSQVLELEPKTGKIMWSYGGVNKSEFWSPFRSGAQRLANGNTLITYREAGEAFEVTKEGKKVWHYRKDPEAPDKPYIYRMTKINRSLLPLEVIQAL